MQCFRIEEGVERGLLFEQGDEGAYIPAPAGSSLKFLLDDELKEAIREFAPLPLQLVEARAEFGDGFLMLKPAPKRRDKQALVRVETAAGIGGRVRLMSCSYTSVLGTGRDEVTPRVYIQNHPFPDAGVLAFCTKKEMERVNNGVDVLDVLMLLHQGARFRIQRGGELYGISPWIDVRWDGYRLTLKTNNSYERAEATELLTEATAAVEEATG
jgi:hypothetical protein